MRGARLGWLAVGFALLSILGEGVAASAQAASRPGARHRHRARLGTGRLVAHHRALKRSDFRVQPDANAPPDVAFVTITTAAKGTSFFVDSRRVGTGSRVRQSLPPGYHRFQAVHPSGARWQKYLSFDAGDDRQLIIHW